MPCSMHEGLEQPISVQPTAGSIMMADKNPILRPQVIMDNMMNLEVLFTSANLTGNDYLRDIAMSHADKAMENHVRADGKYFSYAFTFPQPWTVRITLWLFKSVTTIYGQSSLTTLFDPCRVLLPPCCLQCCYWRRHKARHRSRIFR